MDKKQEKTERYWMGIGRRKRAVASVMIKPGNAKKYLVNSRELENYFSLVEYREQAMAPLSILEQKDIEVSVVVRGGGIRGQAEAVRHGLSRALVKYNPDFRQKLKQMNFLTRDPRKVERKKPGLKKARRAPQFSKR